MSTLRLPTVNQVALTGRLVQDPELHRTENGTARLVVRLAVNRPYRDRHDVWQVETAFIPLVVWHKLAEYSAERLHKGAAVFVTGRLHSFSWTDEEGKPHSRLEVQARSLQTLEKQAASSTDEISLEEAEEDIALEEEETELALA
ncbi:MAG: single-stranded DNA-binding protein [Candidatus Latescibacteria bacterium]|nr:single-stranded DNA-binding protein [Candidatus Latescibacterota bacterium]